jgi:hypothetical protein
MAWRPGLVTGQHVQVAEELLDPVAPISRRRLRRAGQERRDMYMYSLLPQDPAARR